MPNPLSSGKPRFADLRAHMRALRYWPFALLLVLPPFKDFATAIVSKFPVHPGMTVDGTVVLISLALGFCGVVLLQAIGTAIVHTIWWTVKR